MKDSIQRLLTLVDRASSLRRSRLRSNSFTIISNDCWGAEVYKDFNLPFGTPLIGTFVQGPCFMRLLVDCARILRTPIAFSRDSRYAAVQTLKSEVGFFPTGLLDEGRVEIQFLHYKNESEARVKWEKRVKRIVDDRLFFKLSGDKDDFTEEHYRVFDAMPLQRKIALSKDHYPDLASVITVPDWTRDGKLMYERSLRVFDIVTWLNS